MPALNLYHDAVIRALQADGWTITDDPLRVSFGGRDLYVDLGAERILIGAERRTERIAVEVQSFLGLSPVRDLQEAVGQYTIYELILATQELKRKLFLAVPLRVREGILGEQFGRLIIENLRLHVLVFDEQKETVIEWIN